ncbi:MAG: hypothetical protein JRK53_03410 [Deltaproteobacteria bacterium]|nr:hypothetical protein [Deltaproteobacteria bacterium]MBW1816523.1 hypothetical protein [Deltaproteobacteria bacterium]
MGKNNQEILQGAAVELKLDSSQLYIFSPLLQRGVDVYGQVGVSITEFLCQQIGASPEYVEKRIQTIFLNGKPVDDEDLAILSDGDTLALSASMPGALGATMRKGGFFSPLRYQISHTPEEKTPTVVDGIVTLKLFNIILKELAGLVLSRGISVDGGPLAELLARQGEVFWKGLREISVDGKIVDREEISKVDWSGRNVLVKVEVTDASLA